MIRHLMTSLVNCDDCGKLFESHSISFTPYCPDCRLKRTRESDRIWRRKHSQEDNIKRRAEYKQNRIKQEDDLLTEVVTSEYDNINCSESCICWYICLGYANNPPCLNNK